MKPNTSSRRRIGPFHKGNAAKQQRGVVLLFSMIALVIMLIAAVAMVRSFQTSLFNAGNLGFKRDMRNQSEMATSAALAAFSTGLLNTTAQRAASNTLANYSATLLTTNAQGIPDALQDANFATYGVTGNDIKSPDQSVTVRYVIDRLCKDAGDEKALATASCVLANNGAAPGGSALNLQSAERGGLATGAAAAVAQGVVYRLSVRVNGPRNTQSFFQSTFTVPS
jgi:type IV pilus assembly protein PilX